MLVHDSVGIYLGNPFGGNIDLVPADRFPCRIYLTVDICKADLIVINKIESAHSRPCKSLCGISAHSAYSENRNT